MLDTRPTVTTQVSSTCEDEHIQLAAGYGFNMTDSTS